MTISTLTGNSNFTPVRMCDLNSNGHVLHGLETFGDNDKRLLDWIDSSGTEGATILCNESENRLEIQAPTSFQSITSTPIGEVPMSLVDIDGDFDFEIQINQNNNETTQNGVPALIFYIDDNNDFVIYRYNVGGTWSSYARSHVAGSRDKNDGLALGDADSIVEHRLKRSGNVFTAYARLKDAESWNQIGETYTQAYSTTAKIGFAHDYNTAQNTAYFTNAKFNVGAPSNASFKINSSGYTKINVGNDYVVSKESIFAESSGALTVKEDVNYTGAFSGYGAESGWLSPSESGNYPFQEDTGQYLWPYITMSGDGSTFETFSYDIEDSPFGDLLPPSGIEVYYSYKDENNSSIDVFLKWHNGYDRSDGSGTISGYKGASLGYYNLTDSNWYYLQSGENWDTTENFADLYFYEGSGAKWIEAFGELPSGVSQIRYTSWDNAGNNSTRTDEDLLTGTGLSNYGSGVIYYSEKEYYENQEVEINSENNGFYVFNPFGN